MPALSAGVSDGWRRYHGWVVRRHPAVWMLGLHVVVPVWVAVISLACAAAWLVPSSKATDITSAFSAIGILYLGTLAVLLAYGVLVVRRIRLFADVVVWPIRTVVFALLTAVLIASPPILVYQVAYTRMDGIFGWTDGEFCADIRAFERVVRECGGDSLDREAPTAWYLATQIPGELTIFARCAESHRSDDFVPALRRATEMCSAYAACRPFPPNIVQVAERDLARVPSGACKAWRAGKPSGFIARALRVQKIAGRGPWTFRLLDYSLFVSATLVGAAVFAALCVRRRAWVRALRLAAAGVGFVVFYETFLGKELAVDQTIAEENFIAVILLLFGACVALAVAARRLARPPGFVMTAGILALASAPFVTILALYWRLGWYRQESRGVVEAFASIGEYVMFGTEQIPFKLELYPPDTWQHYANLYLPHLLGICGVVAWLITLWLVAPGVLRVRDAPDSG